MTTVSAPNTGMMWESHDLSGQPALREALASLNVRELTADYEPVFRRWQESQCPLCLDDFVDGKSVAILPCGHYLDVSCATEIIIEMDNQRCPECRSNIFPECHSAAIRAERSVAQIPRMSSMPETIAMNHALGEAAATAYKLQQMTPQRPTQEQLDELRARNETWANSQLRVADRLERYAASILRASEADTLRQKIARDRKEAQRVLGMDDRALWDAIRSYSRQLSDLADSYMDMARIGRLNVLLANMQAAIRSRRQAIAPDMSAVAEYIQALDYFSIAQQVTMQRMRENLER